VLVAYGWDSTVQLTARYGGRVLELAKGWDAVELASTDALVPVLEQFKAAAECGQMDGILAQQIAHRRAEKAA